MTRLGKNMENKVWGFCLFVLKSAKNVSLLLVEDLILRIKKS